MRHTGIVASLTGKDAIEQQTFEVLAQTDGIVAISEQKPGLEVVTGRLLAQVGARDQHILFVRNRDLRVQRGPASGALVLRPPKPSDEQASQGDRRVLLEVRRTV